MISLTSSSENLKDLITSNISVKDKIKCPNFAIDGENSVVLCGELNEGLSLLDVSTCKCSNHFQLNSEYNGFLEPVFLSIFTIAICETHTSNTHVLDLRSNSPAKKFRCINSNGFSSNSLSYSITSSFNRRSKENNSSMLIGVISNEGVLVIYDLRNTESPLVAGTVSGKENNSESVLLKPELHFSPNGRTISVSGVDGDVYVNDIQSDGKLEQVFVHDGHKRLNRCKYTKEHLWWKNDYLISTCDQSSVHFWEFNRF